MNELLRYRDGPWMRLRLNQQCAPHAAAAAARPNTSVLYYRVIQYNSGLVTA